MTRKQIILHLIILPSMDPVSLRHWLAGCWWWWRGKYCGGGIQRRFAQGFADNLSWRVYCFFAWIWKPGENLHKITETLVKMGNNSNLKIIWWQTRVRDQKRQWRYSWAMTMRCSPGTLHMVLVWWWYHEYYRTIAWLIYGQGQGTVSSSYNIRYWGWTLYLLNMGNGGIDVQCHFYNATEGQGL